MMPAFASAVEGSNKYVPRMVVQALHILAHAALGFWLFGLWGLLLGFAALIWRPLFRGSRQAKAELDFINQHAGASLQKVMKAHYGMGWLVVVGLKGWNVYSKRGQKAMLNKGKFWDIRLPTEFLCGLQWDIILLFFIVIMEVTL